MKLHVNTFTNRLDKKKGQIEYVEESATAKNKKRR